MENSCKCWTELNIFNVKIGHQSRPYRPEAWGPSDPDLRWVPKSPFFAETKVLLPSPRACSILSLRYGILVRFAENMQTHEENDQSFEHRTSRSHDERIYWLGYQSLRKNSQYNWRSYIPKISPAFIWAYRFFLTYTHAWCSSTPVDAYRLSAKIHLDSCMCAYATVQQLLCHGSCCELILSLAPTSCRLSFADCPPAGSTGSAVRPPAGSNPSPDAVRFKNPSKSTLAHDAVAAAVLHKHHPIIIVGAGLIQFVYGLRSHLADRGYPSQNCIFAMFGASFKMG